MIQYISGDATEPIGSGVKIIAHVCNDVGAWGKGFVTSLSSKWSQPEEAFRALHKAGNEGLGTVELVRVAPKTFVANMYAQSGLRSPNNKQPLNYEALGICLEKVNDLAEAMNASIHMPKIGCGLAGGRWEPVQKIIKEKLDGRDVVVYSLF